MRLPKPKSAPGLFLYGLTSLALLLVGNVIWVLVAQNVENISTDKGYDKLLSQHWAEIVAWFAANGFWLSLATAAVMGGAIALWANVLLQPNVDAKHAADTNTDTREQIANSLTEVYKTLGGITYGPSTQLEMDLAMSHVERYLIGMSRVNDLEIPELRADGVETGLWRALAYLNFVNPMILLNDLASTRERAAEIVPKLNHKSAENIRNELGLKQEGNLFLPDRPQGT